MGSDGRPLNLEVGDGVGGGVDGEVCGVVEPEL